MRVDNHILQAFVKLGNFLVDFCDNDNPKNSGWSKNLKETITIAGQYNRWFTEDNILFALKQWGELLTEDCLSKWLSNYEMTQDTSTKNIAIVMAGNIPLVGFHDFMCVLLTGNSVLVKLSSNDKVLLPFIADFLIDSNRELEGNIHFAEHKLEGFDAVIATGSNNTGRYFEHYFGKHPNIIRKNRSSVAVLSGNETKEKLQSLGEDIFRYFGLGCRSVSKLFVPKGYDFSCFFEGIFEYDWVINNSKYANNHDYNKAVYLMSDFNLFDNNFLLLKEDKSYGSPIGTLYFEYYESLSKLNEKLKNESKQLQCVVSEDIIEGSIPIGTTQKPSLDDYADGIDTIQFLLDL
ncbi:acyl-CoA reductase [Croceitalea sp. MTPC9]|uniref:acyl-CoA reductase n=1 Tax=unclassified Croceitalea TaxID=2632280 RepID=UPI002B387547|nr:acyl-CoA reductase [Croceitalea sp. MTPC6]GMN15816.1 acyl-CoA reductase [Croceitalea sp. MTPC9]